MPVRPVDTEGKKGSCECATLINAKEPNRERCLIVCGAEIPLKHVKCRPCAKGNHTGLPCSTPARETVFHLNNATCANCGIDLALHDNDSTGQPNRS